MLRRAPGRSVLSTARREADEPEILSGLADGVTCGAPMAIIIRNNDARPADYQEIRDIPRPSHADYAAHVKYGGCHDAAGGGHFSGRLTAPLCAAGGVCLQILRCYGIDICAHILSIGGVRGDALDPAAVCEDDFKAIRANPLPALRRETADLIAETIKDARNAKDSVGGVIECAAIGVPAGLGNPIFDGVENRIAGVVFGIPGVKGVEFGGGFACAGRRGSEVNDSFYMDSDTVKTRTNYSGGIQGGITNGMPVLFRAAFKPAPSIGVEQDSVSLSRAANAVLTVRGRHDPCIVPRAVPCVEAAAAAALLDAYLDR